MKKSFFKPDVTIQLIANSGVLVIWGSRRFLVDGIYGKNRFFSPPQKEMQKAVFGMESVYRDVDVVFVTHRHTDHFDAAYVDEYAANNAVRGIYVPRAGQDPHSFLEDRRPLPKAETRGILQEVSAAEGERITIPLGGSCKAVFLPTRHLDWRSYRAVLHCSLLLELGGRRILLAADADHCAENQRAFMTEEPLDVVLVTPLFLSVPQGRRILEEMRPGQVVLYHIPFAPDDVSKLRDLVNRELMQSYAFPLTAFMESGDQISLSAEGPETTDLPI